MPTDRFQYVVSGLAASIKFVYADGDGNAWNAHASAVEAWSDAHYNSGYYNVAVTERGSSREYMATPPIPSPYSWTAYLHVDGTITNDTPIGFGEEAASSLSFGSPVSIQFLDGNSNPVANVQFSVLAGSTAIGSPRAGSDGIATFAVPDGSYFIAAEITNGITFPVTTLTVSGSTSTAIAGSGSPPPPTPPPNTVYATGWVDGQETLYYRLVQQPAGTGVAFSGDTFSVTPDDSGNVSFTVWQNSEYEVWYGRGERLSMTVATTDVTIPNLLSAQTPNAPR